MLSVDLFQWNPAFCIGDAATDEEHRHLFHLANDIITAAAPPLEPDKVKYTVRALFRYMQYHFTHEQELMQRLQFPGCAAHVELHDKIIREMNATLLIHHNLAKLATQLETFMTEWVCRHILVDDMQIGQYLRQNAGQLPQGAQQCPVDAVAAWRASQAAFAPTSPLDPSLTL